MNSHRAVPAQPSQHSKPRIAVPLQLGGKQAHTTPTPIRLYGSGIAPSGPPLSIRGVWAEACLSAAVSIPGFITVIALSSATSLSRCFPHSWLVLIYRPPQQSETFIEWLIPHFTSLRDPTTAPRATPGRTPAHPELPYGGRRIRPPSCRWVLLPQGSRDRGVASCQSPQLSQDPGHGSG